MPSGPHIELLGTTRDSRVKFCGVRFYKCIFTCKFAFLCWITCIWLFYINFSLKYSIILEKILMCMGLQRIMYGTKVCNKVGSKMNFLLLRKIRKHLEGWDRASISRPGPYLYPCIDKVMMTYISFLGIFRNQNGWGKRFSRFFCFFFEKEEW